MYTSGFSQSQINAKETAASEFRKLKMRYSDSDFRIYGYCHFFPFIDTVPKLENSVKH